MLARNQTRVAGLVIQVRQCRHKNHLDKMTSQRESNPCLQLMRLLIPPLYCLRLQMYNNDKFCYLFRRYTQAKWSGRGGWGRVFGVGVVWRMWTRTGPPLRRHAHVDTLSTPTPPCPPLLPSRVLPRMCAPRGRGSATRPPVRVAAARPTSHRAHRPGLPGPARPENRPG